MNRAQNRDRQSRVEMSSESMKQEILSEALTLTNLQNVKESGRPKFKLIDELQIDQ